MLDDYEYHLREAGREIEAMEQGIRSMERAHDRLSEENYQLKQRIRELEDSLLHCARCGRGIGETDDDV